MKNKYRIKIGNERVVGPFSKEQVGELFFKKKIEKESIGQVFPDGEWTHLNSLPEIANLFFEIISKKVTLEDLKKRDLSSVVNKVSMIDENKVENDKIEGLKKSDKNEEQSEVSQNALSEFKFSKTIDDNDLVDYSELEKKYTNSDNNERDEIEQTTINSKSTEDESEVDIATTRLIKIPKRFIGESKKNEDGLNETLIIDRTDLEESLLTNSNNISKADSEIEASEESKSEIENNNETEEDDSHDLKTEIIDLSAIMPDLKERALDNEKIIENEIADELESSIPETDEPEEIPEDKGSVKKIAKKGTKPIVALAFIVILWTLLFPDDEKKGIVPVFANITFPITQEFENSLKSEDAYRAGIKEYIKGSYVNKVRAANALRKSLEFKFRDNDAIGSLILAYSEIYENSKDKEKSGNVIFQLIKIARGRALKDVNVVLGSAIFYMKIKKYHTARKLLENYFRVGKPTIRLLAEYLNVLMKVGDYAQAAKAYDNLSKYGKLPLEAYYYMSLYLKFDERFSESKNLIIKASEVYGRSVLLLLEYCDHILREEDKGRVNKLKKILGAIERLEAELSPKYYSKYLEYMGVLSAIYKKNDLAVKYFEESLRLKESDELRSKLAALELGGTTQVENLILESKSLDLMRSALNSFKSQEWEKAFRLAIDASDNYESFIPAKLLLAKIQIKRGFFNQALRTLEKLRDRYPMNIEINFMLIDALINSYKLSDAQKSLSSLGSTKFVQTAEYSSLLGRYYIKSKNIKLAVSWLNKSVRINPIRDYEYFLLAKIFLDIRKYEQSRLMISQAIELDPENVQYRSLFAKILYEIEGVDTAIGYLREILEKNPDDATILGEIAIYYYQAGQTKNFESYKDRLDKLTVKTTNFYRFMIDASILEDKFDDVAHYAEKLLRINPGNLKVRMLLGKYFLEQGKIARSESIFEEIRRRFEAFPGVNYYLAKLYIEKKKYKEAEEFGKKEVEASPNSEKGYYILGEVSRLEKKYTTAIKYLEKGISLNSKNVEILMSMATIKFRQNYLDEAREMYGRALRVEPSNPMIHRQLGFIYKAIGQSSLAIESFKTYLDLNPLAADKRYILSEIKRLK